MAKVCLSIVFNHQYEKNISKLRDVYGGRFSTIRYLSPFSTFSKDKEIIPVFETSIHFQGYFAQAYDKLPKDCDYYLFCGDDLLLNPLLNENNIINKLNSSNASYIKYLNPVWEHSFAWHKFEECNNFHHEYSQVPLLQFLPNREELIQKYKDFGFEYRNLGFHNLFGIHHKGFTLERFVSGIKYAFSKKCRRYVHFPLIEGYSDFIIIPRKSLASFCHYCGVFAAMNLWVDAAIATAMVLSSEQVRTEKDHSYKGTEIWDQLEVKDRLNKANYELNKLPELFKKNEFYIHPVKLSTFS